MRTSIVIRVAQDYSGAPVTVSSSLSYGNSVVGKHKARIDAQQLSGLTSTIEHHLLGAVRARLTQELNQLELW